MFLESFPDKNSFFEEFHNLEFYLHKYFWSEYVSVTIITLRDMFPTICVFL